MKKKSKIEETVNKVRKTGLKLTYPRISIIKIMAASDKPLSADEIYEKISNDINRVTVYRILGALERADCVSRFTFQNRHVYELAVIHSHYLICKECEKVERIPSCTLDDIENSSLKYSKKFASLGHHTLQLTGLCKKCI